ncbi:MAG TPA: hypothetical protein VGP90_02535, partial [Acidimicrobiia bacterium]|nr:hypothetical protein [Acidimicrobiia bacterium]
MFADDGSPAWGLELSDDREPLVGPVSAFRLRAPTITVAVVEAGSVPEGRVLEQRQITEWKGASAIEYYAFDGYDGLFHHGGGNWVLWNHDLDRFFVTADASWPTTWVHIRFVLRHLIVAGLIARPDHHCLHAVVAEVDSSAGPSGLLVCGPTGSGKTRLVNRLVEVGAVSAVVEDDCAVVDGGWVLTSLIPTEHELRRPRHLPIGAVVVLDAQCGEPEAVPGRTAAEFAAACPTPWPAAWLPGATPRPAQMADPPAR